MATRARLTASTVLDAAGSGECAVAARAPFAVWHVRVETDPAPGHTAVVNRSTAMLYLDGASFEGTAAGWGDSSDSSYELQPGEEVRCRWSGGDPGATAHLIVRGTYNTEGV